jgi:DNA polymerase-1
MPGLPFEKIWFFDFEFSAPDGERPVVRCLVASEFFSGRIIRIWLDGQQPPPPPPFRLDGRVLLVGYFATADLNCFLALGWPLPARLVDLYVEFKRHICGRDGEPDKPSVVYALDWFGLDSLDVNEKGEMRQLAMRGGPYSDDERHSLTKYCESDVRATASLFDAMLPLLDLPRAVLRGEFDKAVSHVEHNGVPVDVESLTLLDEHWGALKYDMVRDVDTQYGVYDEGGHFREERFARWLGQKGIPWPRLESDRLCLSKEVFRDMAVSFPVLQPLHQLRQTLSILRLADLPVGRDGRNRCMMSPFGTITGRCTPSTTGFILARPAWMRSLIQPTEGRSLTCLDWSSQEYGVGAVLSGDRMMIADYEAGDPYLSFAKRIGIAPPGATKQTHRAERDIVKTVILGTQYGMGEQTLAVRIGKPVAYARELLRAHRSTYPKFWEWVEAAVNLALFRGRLWTRYGWQTHARAGRAARDGFGDPNTRSLANVVCQGNAADMLRLAASFICNAGLQLDATIHDAVLVEADTDDIDAAAKAACEAMDRASRLVLSGFTLRTEVQVIRWPDRYRDDRGAGFFDKLMSRLKDRHASRGPFRGAA